jgi:hypothetical protein
MKFIASMVTLSILIAGSQIPANAEVKSDKALKHSFSYVNDTPVLKPDTMTLFLLELPKQKDSSGSKVSPDKPQCFATNKQFVNCFH